MRNLPRKTFLYLSIWAAAGVTGVVAVYYARLIAWAQSVYMHVFQGHPYLVSLSTPVLFLVATAAVHFLAEEAKGSGIPQVLEAITVSQTSKERLDIWVHRLVSIRTASVKILSSTIGIFGGASIGREGPTVQIAASVFSSFGNQVRKIYPEADFTSFATAGAAAGVAAAFNTPFAGITFAMEELAEEAFGSIKRVVVLGVVIAGLAAQVLAGDYLYFGHPAIPPVNLVELALQAAAIGLLGGLLGGWFARLLAHRALPLPKSWWTRALVCGVICSAIGLLAHGDTAGSGYEVTRSSLESNGVPALSFPLLKFVTTVFSYLSGMAGGLFSPCLTIGAGIGFSVATIFHLASVKACALLGMVAFFTGVVQAPLTAVVIVMEMTDQHDLILPFIVAALVAHGIGKILMPTPLYRFLAEQGTKLSAIKISVPSGV
jgi:H+/Cl- antiporter ClcA